VTAYSSLLWGDSGVIESPNFPDPYGPNMDCLWLLQTADEDARIKLVCDTIQVPILPKVTSIGLPIFEITNICNSHILLFLLL
jgi:hypothetical protein